MAAGRHFEKLKNLHKKVIFILSTKMKYVFRLFLVFWVQFWYQILVLKSFSRWRPAAILDSQNKWEQSNISNYSFKVLLKYTSFGLNYLKRVILKCQTIKLCILQIQDGRQPPFSNLKKRKNFAEIAIFIISSFLKYISWIFLHFWVHFWHQIFVFKSSSRWLFVSGHFEIMKKV